MRNLPDNIKGIGQLSARVIRNPSFEPQFHRGLGPGHHELWNRIGHTTSIRELLEGSSMKPDDAIAFLRQLIMLHAIQIGEPIEAVEAVEDADSSDFEIVDPTELTDVTPEERRLLEEDVELEAWQRSRILAARRQLRSGNLFDFLGIRVDSSRRELKRAYFELSKEFHPDRYYGKNLGSYGALLSQIFEQTADAVRELAARSVGSAGSRRRMSERYAFPINLLLQCASWSSPVQLVTQDISEHGLFVVTTESASRGDRIRASIAIKRGEPLWLSGRVAQSRPAAVASKMGRRPGIGIELDPVDDERYARILEAARRSTELEPERPETASEGVPQQRKLARGSGSFEAMPTVLGIDFGTTNTAISVTIGNKIHLVPWPDGQASTPSVVSFPRAHQPVVGEPARRRLASDPTHTIGSVKRLLGVPFSDRNIQGLIGQAAYPTSKAPDGGVSIEMWGGEYAIPQVVAIILRAARDAAEAHLGAAVERVVLTVPVGFDAKRLAAIERAAMLAQLEVVGVIDEPTAAALANRTDPRFQGIIGVYDFGGGTFDFSVVDTSAGDVRVLGTAGDTWLGGDDFDAAIANATANQIWRRHGQDLRTRAVDWQRLLFACERTKRRLSSIEDHAILALPAALRTAAGEQDLRIRLDRATCERLWTPLIERSMETVKQGLRRAGIAPSRLTAICLSGGTAYIPAVRKMVSARLGVPALFGVPPEYAACIGASAYAAQAAQTLSMRAAG